MNRTHQTFRINTGFLINQPIGYSKTFSYSIETFPFEDIADFKDMQGSIKLSRTQSGVLAFCSFQGKMILTCGRCLDDSDQKIQTTFEEIFSFKRDNLSEDEIPIPEDGFINFEDFIVEYLLLEVPINPLCSLDCRGLCSVCGQNLNQKECEHAKLETKNRMSS